MNIAVIYGGTSPENDISIKSGTAIANALRSRGHYVSEFKWNEKQVITSIGILQKYDVVFIGYHGGAGEDGHVQAVLELAGIPFTGSGSVASALGMNKILSKKLFEKANVPTPEWDLLENERDIADITNRLGKTGLSFPLVIKPSSQGSTVGVSIVDDKSALQRAIEHAHKFDRQIIVEKYIKGREITVSILGDKALPTVEVVPVDGFYDYEHKYTKGKTRYICPAETDTAIDTKLKEYAITAFNALGCRHYARVDFRLSEKNEIFCLEVNTLPGMTDLSLVPMEARQVGIDFPELVEIIAKMGYEEKGR